MLIKNDSLAYQFIDSSNQDQAIRRICYMNNIKSVNDQSYSVMAAITHVAYAYSRKYPKGAVKELNGWELVN